MGVTESKINMNNLWDTLPQEGANVGEIRQDTKRYGKISD